MRLVRAFQCPLAQRAAEARLLRCTQPFRHEPADGLPQHLFRPIAEQALGGRVPGGDGSAGIGRHNRISGAVGDQPEACFAVFQQLQRAAVMESQRGQLAEGRGHARVVLGEAARLVGQTQRSHGPARRIREMSVNF